MSENKEIRCPQCATLYAAQEGRCPHCGLPTDAAARQEYIEQLLQHKEEGKPAILTDPASAAFERTHGAADRPAAGTAVTILPPSVSYAAQAPNHQVKWESVPLGEPAAAATQPQSPLRRFLKEHKAPLLLTAGAVVLLLAVVLTLVGLYNARLGYRASPERLVAGMQRAINNQDMAAYLELIMPQGTEVEDYIGNTAVYDFALPEMRLEIVDVLSGKNGRYAIAVVEAFELGDAEDVQSQQIMLSMVKQDGRWYCDTNAMYSLLYGMGRDVIYE